MTNYNKATLATFFQNGDVPQGSDYTNLINSQVNIVETAAQQMAGPLGVTELDTPLVSAATVNATTLLTAAALNITGAVSAASFNATGNTKAATGTFTGIVSAKGGLNATIVSAATINTGIFRTSTPVIVSAAGTSQATAALISSSVGITRLQGATDGQTTGYILPAPGSNIGIEQLLVHENAVSANLWPSVGCSINNSTANTVFPLAAKTPYYVTYVAASAYAVK